MLLLIKHFLSDSSNLDSRDVSDDVKVKLELRAVEHDGDIDIETNMSDRVSKSFCSLTKKVFVHLISSY